MNLKLKKLLLIIISFLGISIGAGFVFAQTSSVSPISPSANSGVAQSTPTVETDLNSRLKFFLVLVPAAISDSINPCEFAILLLLLSSILTRHKSYKKMYLAGGLFILAVFISYLAMGLGLYKALATASNTYYLKLVVGVVGIIVGLFNIKDYFWWDGGGLFAMEVPLAWRPKMHKIVQSMVSPWGAFAIGIVISLFLLPCTSGPYITILGYLAAESKTITTWGSIYLLVYNLIFIIPMIAIVVIVGTGFKSIDELAKLRKQNLRLLHLIIGILMLGLGFYVILNAFNIINF